MKQIFLLATFVAGFKFSLFIAVFCVLFILIISIRNDSNLATVSSSPDTNCEGESEADIYKRNAIKTTFNGLNGKIANLDRVDITDYGFEELWKFQAKVDEINQQLNFLSNSKSVTLPVTHVETLHTLQERVGEILDRINSREHVLQSTPYKNPFKVNLNHA